ncbi:outer membrane protein [uncultured Methylovirgula sp.]|uniref:outer membrane protein n=1 Tax=uncultured Methylovirgula sp. TaxID=1285960 RepID=UPI0026385998|nr:outer membrane beta-barrel protein [uncultured Methylovirgula sp.]
MGITYRAAGLGFGFALIATTALAADLPSAKASPVPAFGWTGFHVDVGSGYGEWAANTTTRVPASTGCALCLDQVQGGRGFFGRVGAGFDYQFARQFVAGAFADGSYGGLRGTLQDQAANVTGNVRETWSWAAGVRLGTLITPDIFAYADAGFTQSHFTGSDLLRTTNGAVSGNSISGFDTPGWFVGGGLETALAPGWFWRSEYRLADYGARVLGDNGAAGRLDDLRVHPIVQTVTSGIVYKFGWPAMNPAGLPPFGVGDLVQDLIAPPTGPSLWTGPYLEAGAGYGISSADTIVKTAYGACVTCVDQIQGGRGIGGRIGLGYDYQLTGKIVAGAFGDFDPAGLSGTIQDEPAGQAATLVERWSWGGGARLGFLATPQILTYSKFGFTQAHFGGSEMLDSANGAPSGVSTHGLTTNGWLLGDGIEAQLAPGWFWQIEYRYAQYGARDIGTFSAAGQGDAIHFHPEIQSAVAGLIYKFDSSPVTLSNAKY